MIWNILRSRRTKTSRHHNPSPRRFRPSLESLEDRCVPATFHWLPNADGDFNDPANWDRGTVPGAGDDAIISQGGIMVTSSVNNAINSLFSNARFRVAGGTFSVDDVIVNTWINQLMLTSGATFEVTGGTASLANGSDLRGTLSVLTGASLAFSGGTNTVYAGASLAGPGHYRLFGGLLSVADSSTITAPADFAIAGGVLTGSGIFEVPDSIAASFISGAIAGPMLVDAGGALNISGGSQKDFNGATFTNNGTVNWTDGGNIVTGNGAVLTNNNLWNIQNDQGLFHAYGNQDTFTNSGTLRKSTATGNSGLNLTFNNTGGTIDVQSGNLYLPGGVSTGGTYTVASDSLLDLTSGWTQWISGTFTGSGDGRVRFSGGALRVLAAGATFNFPTKLFQWAGGQLQSDVPGAALTNLGTVNISGGSQMDFNGITFNNQGSVTWSGIGKLVTGNGAMLNNSGTWTMDNNQRIDHAYGNPDIFNNSGTLRKSIATGDSAIYLIFNNNGGTVEVLSGNLYLPGGTSTGGTYNVAAGSLLDLTSGLTQTISGNFTGSGGGTVQLSSGTLNTLAAGATFNFPDSMLRWTGGQLTSDVPGATFTNSGNLAISGARIDFNGATFTNSGAVTWTGSGNIVTGNAAVINNAGVWSIRNDQGFFHAYGNQDVFNNSGTLSKDVGLTTAATFIGFVFNNAGPNGVVSVNHGVLQLGAGGIDSGTFTAAAGTYLQFTGGTHTLLTGTMLPSNGFTWVTGGATVIVTDVIGVQNFGLINGTLRITSTGILNVGGDYDQTTNGSLVVEIGGTTAAAGFGQLNVTGTADLAGSFTAVLVDDFAPSIGDSYAVITYGSRNGLFNNVFLPGLPPDRLWDAEYGPTGFTLTVIPSP